MATEAKPDYSFAQLPTTTPMNRLPLVITKPGEYRTRGGLRATVHEIKMYVPTMLSNLRHEVTVFEAKGTIWYPRGKSERPIYNIWHLSGRNAIAEPDPMDIVGPWSV